MEVKIQARLPTIDKMRAKATKFNISYTLAKDFATTLKKVITQRSPSSSGNLARTINAKKVGRYGAGVYADYYFWYANDGRLPGRLPPDDISRARFEAWASANGWDSSTLSANIAKYGTKPKNYFAAAKQILAIKKKRAYKKITK